MMGSSQPPPVVRRFVAWTLKYGRFLWLIALLAAVPAAIRTASLYIHLKTGVDELLPREAPSVRALNELRGRMQGVEHLGVVIDVGKPENLAAGEKLLDDLAARIRTYPKNLVRSVRVGNAEERKFVEANAPLYVDLEDLKAIRNRIEARRDYEVQKQLGTLLDDEGPPSLDVSDLEKKYKDRLGPDRFPTGRFSSAELHLTLLLMEAGWGDGGGANDQLFNRVQADLRDLGGPDRYAPGMRVGYTGDVAITVEETSALISDLAISSVIVLVAVLAVLIAYYRWWRSVLILMPPLLLAAVYAFAVASLPPIRITELNSNTAFLGSIIVGNGINFAIVLLARYVEERRAGRVVEDALGCAVWGALWGTLAAALGAGVAYGSLGITEFRGFRQFGYIGGLGMVFSWLSAFVLMPPLAALVDRGSRAAPKPVKTGHSPMALVARLVVRRPGAIALAMGIVTVVAAVKVRGFDHTQLEYDIAKLRRADTWQNGEGYWGHRMDELLGEYLTPLIVLADDPDGARSIGKALRDAAREQPLSELVASVRTLDDVVPVDQPAKIEEIEAIRKDLTPRLLSAVPADKRQAIDRVLGRRDLKPITAADVPETFTLGMRERDGSIGRTVLVYPRPSTVLWLGPTITSLVDSLRGVSATARPDKPPGRVAGALPLTADIFGSLQRDGPLATIVAFVGVAAVVMLLFRRSATSAGVIVSLCVGVLWLVALAMALHIKVNFTNFIAYPITFGIGVDYSVNVMSRYMQDGARDVVPVLRTTGGAVALCSCTTIIGYSSLLIAQNRALYLFGLLAVLGEIACLSAAIIALPAFLRWLETRRATVKPSAISDQRSAS